MKQRNEIQYGPNVVVRDIKDSSKRLSTERYVVVGMFVGDIYNGRMAVLKKDGTVFPHPTDLFLGRIASDNFVLSSMTTRDSSGDMVVTKVAVQGQALFEKNNLDIVIELMETGCE